MDDQELAELFGSVIAEIAERTGRTDKETMYELARRFWDEEDGDGD